MLNDKRLEQMLAKGLHWDECVYSLYPHDAGFAASLIVQPAYELNCPLLIVAGRGGPGAV